MKSCPGWCGSVDWVPACEPKGCWFDSQSGHMPGLWARSPVGGTWEATMHWCFSPSLSPSLPLSLKINVFLKNEILPFKTTWIDLEDIMLSEISQIKKNKYCIISCILWNLTPQPSLPQTPDLIDTEADWWLPEEGVGEMARGGQKVYKFQL